jgi:hypothetical protein
MLDWGVNMIKVKMGAIVKNVPDPTWYIIAGWKVLEEISVKTNSKKTTSK